MIIPHIQPQPSRTLAGVEDKLIGYCEAEPLSNAVLDMHDVADSIPHRPEAFKKSAISDLLGMWSTHLRTCNLINRGG